MRRRLGTRSAFAAVLVAAVALLWALRTLSPWADRTSIFLASFSALVFLVLLLDWLIALIGPGLWRLLRSVGVSVGHALREDTEVRSLQTRHPRVSSWLVRRLSTRRASGLYLSVTVLAALYFLSGFISIARSLALSAAITRFDPQVEALLRAFRTPALTRVLWGATLISDLRVVALATLGATILLVVWGRRAQGALVGVTVLGGLLLYGVARLSIHRASPSGGLALIRHPFSPGFPAGPVLASALLLGSLLFVLWRATPHLRVRLAVSTATLLAGVYIAVAWVYAGAYWLSDIVAAWSLAAAWLSLTCGAYLIRVRYNRLAQKHTAMGSRRARVTATAALVVALLVGVSAGSAVDPLLLGATAAPATTPWTASVSASGTPVPTSAQIKQLPLFSEKLDGSPQEPVGIIFVGSSAQLRAAFRSAGWQVADKPTLVTLARASAAAIANNPYPTAPVTPTFLGGGVQNVAFEKSAGTATVRRRHHARFWMTGKTFRGEPVWVATASYDSRLEVGSAIPLPTHRIDANIDAEQSYIVGDLVAAGRAALAGRVRVTPPLAGTNAQGDQWFTQGFASILLARR